MPDQAGPPAPEPRVGHTASYRRRTVGVDHLGRVLIAVDTTDHERADYYFVFTADRRLIPVWWWYQEKGF